MKCGILGCRNQGAKATRASRYSHLCSVHYEMLEEGNL